MDENLKIENDFFMESLGKYPPGSIAYHYKELWDTLNSIEEGSVEDRAIMIDSAFDNFSKRFVSCCSESFEEEMNNPEVQECMFKNMNWTFNRVAAKIGNLIDPPSEI